MSEASEDVEMHSKCSSVGAITEDPKKPQHHFNQGTFSNMIKSSNSEEVHNENISCVSGPDVSNKPFGYVNRIDVDRSNASCSSVSVTCIDPDGFGKSVHYEGNSDISCDVEYNHTNSREPNGFSVGMIGGVSPHLLSSDVVPKKLNPSPEVPDDVNFFSESSDSKDLTEHSHPDKKNSANTLVSRESSLLGHGSDVPMKINSMLAADTNKSNREISDGTSKQAQQDEHGAKLNDSVELPDLQEPALQAASSDENDESEIVEHDVNVCDICGDAGREDLLATCSRCSDGAEHIYCMRERLDKVPECDWLCEDCRFAECVVNQKQDRVQVVGGNEKNQSSDCPNRHGDVKLDSKDIDLEANKANNSDHEVNRKSLVNQSSQVSVNRRLYNAEPVETAKLKVFETTLRSPKSSVPRRAASLSFKNLEKGKMKPYYHPPSTSRSFNRVSERSSAAQRLQTPKGILQKANSFSTSSLQTKVKHVDEAIPQSQKGVAREVGQTADTKDWSARSIGKSMSFKSLNSGRPNATEAKVKMLSPNVSQAQELRGFKPAKDQTKLEKNNFSRLDRSSASTLDVLTSKVAQKSTCRGEANLRNSGDFKGAPSDARLSGSSKPNSHQTHKVGSSSTDGAGGPAEQTSNQVALKDEDGLPPSRESTNEDDKMKDNCLVRSRGKSINSPKGSEIHHSAQFCAGSSTRASVVDLSDARSSGELMGSGSRLKAAIEAAMLRKPGIYKKNKLTDPSNEISVLSTNVNCGSALQDQNSNKKSLENLSVGFCKKPTSNSTRLAHITELEFSLKDGDSDSDAFSDGKVSVEDFCSQNSAPLFVPSMIFSIPEPKCIWQGCFEVESGGRLANLYSGFQAHRSTCASPKVLEVVCKFSEKVSLHEVTRLSSWPSQFHTNGVKDDNIGLYFFAKDLESYERNYRPLLENLMRNDFALKGNFNGIELLIFPSNQLPNKSQRWNMLFFLWGIFRVKRLSCLDEISGSSKKIYNPSVNAVEKYGIIPAVMSVPASRCTLPQFDGNSCAEMQMPPTLPSDNYKTRACLDEPVELKDPKFELPSLPAASGSGASPNQDLRCTLNLMKEQTDADHGPDQAPKLSTSITRYLSGNKDVIVDGEKINEVKLENLKREDESIQIQPKEEEVLVVTQPEELVSDPRKRKFPASWEEGEKPIKRESRVEDEITKKPKTCLSEIYSSSGCTSSLGSLFSSHPAPGPSIHSPELPGALDETENPEESVTSERHFFPLDLRNTELLADNSVPRPREDDDGSPNLELALGAERKVLPLFVGVVDKSRRHGLDRPLVREETEDAAGLSLSLSFPYSGEERATKPEQLLGERHPGNGSSLILFGGFRDP